MLQTYRSLCCNNRSFWVRCRILSLGLDSTSWCSSCGIEWTDCPRNFGKTKPSLIPGTPKSLIYCRLLSPKLRSPTTKPKSTFNTSSRPASVNRTIFNRHCRFWSRNIRSLPSISGTKYWSKTTLRSVTLPVDKLSQLYKMDLMIW